jgi:2-octaprenyl-6-methoxyphenol hydroxylase
MNEFKVLISGSGPAGLTAAILLAQENISCAVVAPGMPVDDNRTVALMQPSIRLLKFIGIWPGELQAHCAPLQHLHMVDDTGNLVQAPNIEFSASEMGHDAFGWNVPIVNLVPALRARAEELGVEFITGRSQSMFVDGTSVILTLDDGQKFKSKVILAADGVNSPLRNALGISMTEWKFDQCAMATSLSHTLSHNNTSVEWHKAGGPFATVPLPGLKSSLVWMDRPQRIAELMALPDAELAAEIQIETHGKLGRIFEMGQRKSFPMSGRRATRLAKSRCLLLAEAAHILPPVGAQGLNLSLRDAAFAADVIIGESDPGAESVMQAYEKAREFDIAARQQTVSLMNHTLLADSAPLNLARVAGLTLVNYVPPLRAQAMREGLSPSSGLPFAMRA